MTDDIIIASPLECKRAFILTTVFCLIANSSINRILDKIIDGVLEQ